MPRLVFPGGIDGTRSSIKYLMRVEKEKFGEDLYAETKFKAKPLPPKQSVKFKCQMELS